MYRGKYQRGMLTIFFSGGSNPLAIWETKTKNGYIKRYLDPEIKTMVLEIRGNNISTAYMSCPKDNQVLGITMPFLVMIVKNLMKYFSFEVTILDSTGTRRRFRASNFQSTTQILPLCTVMPIGLAPGWNQIQFNLAEFTRRAYKNQFVEVQRLKINANIRIRRIYFTEKLMTDDELPMEYKLYFPLQQKKLKSIEGSTSDKQNNKSSQEITLDKRVSKDKSKSSLKNISGGSVRKSKKSLEDVPVKQNSTTITKVSAAEKYSDDKNLIEAVGFEEATRANRELLLTGEEMISIKTSRDELYSQTDTEDKFSEEIGAHEIKHGVNVDIDDQGDIQEGSENSNKLNKDKDSKNIQKVDKEGGYENITEDTENTKIFEEEINKGEVDLKADEEVEPN